MKDFKYRVIETASNSVRLSPYIGQRFSEDDYNAIKLLIDKSDYVAKSFRDGAGLRVLFKEQEEDMEAIVSDIVPKAMTNAEKKREASLAKSERIKKENEERYKQLRESEPEAYAWMLKIFGDGVMNEYNLAAMVEFITGKEPKFEGLMNHRCRNGLNKISALGEMKNNMQTILFDKIKEAYKNDI